MKRSCDFEEEKEVTNQKETKQIKIETDSDSASEAEAELSSSDESNSSFSEEIGEFPKDSYFPYEEEVFDPSLIEKQVIRQSLALICRSNMSDWACELKENTMLLRDVGVVMEGCEGICSDIVVEITYDTFNTYCHILYSLNNQERKSIYLRWETEFVGNYETFDTISISKYVDKTVFLFFTKTIRQTRNFNPRECEEDGWCYFADARSHLEKISL